MTCDRPFTGETLICHSEACTRGFSRPEFRDGCIARCAHLSSWRAWGEETRRWISPAQLSAPGVLPYATTTT